ncbi:MAG: efflux RND transporter periplasmic adaptor subunit [Chlorobi bacterium]|nr:efflux RND transporter periplasmic adaptor subunit [Chlorobiota bacterium]
MIKHIKLTGISVFIITLFACNSQQGTDVIKKNIEKYKTERSELTHLIDSLELVLRNDTTLSKQKFKVPVSLKTLKRSFFAHYFEANGSVEAIESAFISPEINGQIKSVLVEEGQKVKKGQILIRLKSDITQKGIEEVKTGLELATKIYEKQKELWDKKIGSELQYLQAKNNKQTLEGKLETLQAQLDMAVIRAPFDGIVDKIVKKEGELASPGLQLIQLVNLSQLNINADVSENYISKIHKGDKVKISFPSYPGLVMEANVHRIGNIINPSNRTFEIQVRINNEDNMLKPNMIAIIQVNDFKKDSALVVPSIIIKTDITGNFLFKAIKDNGRLISKKVYVETGMTYKEQTMITKGLQEGDKIITSGYNMVTNGIGIAVK